MRLRASSQADWPSKPKPQTMRRTHEVKVEPPPQASLSSSVDVSWFMAFAAALAAFLFLLMRNVRQARVETKVREALRPVGPPGPNADVLAPEGIRELLWDAAHEGKTDELAALCEEWSGNEAVLNWAHFDGVTPYIIACAAAQVDCVMKLVTTPGLRINQGDANGCTGLGYASYYGRHEVVKILITVEGIDLDQAPTRGDAAGKTPLRIAREGAAEGREGCSAVVELLEAAGARESL